MHGEDRVDRQASSWRELIAVGFGNLLDQPVGAEHAELSTDSRRESSPLEYGKGLQVWLAPRMKQRL